MDTVNSIRHSKDPVLDACVDMGRGKTLTLKSTYDFDEKARVLLAPGLYEPKEGDSLLRSETMDFRIRLYEVGEMERILSEVGFPSVRTYSSFDKEENPSNDCDCFIYECRP